MISLITMSFSQCKHKSKLETQAPLELGEVYYKKWVVEPRGGGSGINLFITIKSNINKIVLDSVYFMDKTTKLVYIKDTLVMGRFKTSTNQPIDIVMSNEPYGEYGNKLPTIIPKLPFALHPNECIVSYKTDKKTKYFKISNITIKHNKSKEAPL
ncbi:hypothetical protein [Litoribaculum gwangyangense]|uniref:Uncharacterized protein n=1 Tax=Litoribaculum gwangyangense TaxID=1130722 RepID=A0ABP9BZ91_9FLAO